MLTGYLGYRQDNHPQSHPLGGSAKKYAVIVNEFSEVSIGNDLVVYRRGNLREMNQRLHLHPFAAISIRILEEPDEAWGKFDAVIIETTGLADPTPVAQTFFMDDEVRAKTRLDAIVTVVDAKNLMARIEDSPEDRGSGRLRRRDPA